jgi:hypothetical protein
LLDDGRLVPVELVDDVIKAVVSTTHRDRLRDGKIFVTTGGSGNDAP